MLSIHSFNGIHFTVIKNECKSMHIFTINSQKMQLCVFLFTNFNCLLALSKVCTNHVIICPMLSRDWCNTHYLRAVSWLRREQTSRHLSYHRLIILELVICYTVTTLLKLIQRLINRKTPQKSYCEKDFYIYLHHRLQIKWNVSLWNSF